MRITKFVHSCLLVETAEIRVLIDPGNFSYQSHLLNVRKLEDLDFIVITHEHADHYHEPFLRLLSRAFPRAAVVTNNDLADKVKALKLPNPLRTGSEDNLVIFEAVHYPLPLDQPVPPNIGVHIAEKLTHPGDALDIKASREVLALPLAGPWTSIRESLAAAVELKPKIVIPIHDWEWHKSARENRYEMSKKLLAPHDIEFIALENAEPIEL